jgi:conjugal transfer/entry exclusion protein
MPSDAAIEMFSIIDDFGASRWRTRRDRVHRAMRARGYTVAEIRAAETELTSSGTIECCDRYLEWTRPTL